MKIIQRTLLAFLVAAIPAAAADAIAFITNMKGEVAVDGNARPLLLAELARGQKIAVGKDSQASVMYIATGKEYVLKGPDNFVVKDTDISSAAGMPPVTRETPWRASNRVLVQVAQTSAASVRMRSIAQPKADTAPRLLYPTEGSVATLEPTFRWRAPDPKLQGDFTLMLIGQDKPVHVARAVGGSYRVPVKLRPESDYAWTVTSAGSEIGSGKFRTLSTEALTSVARRKPSDKSDFSDRLLFTLLLQEMGATQEAQESWARLAAERADLPELAGFAK
ncbi:MAG: hypothetical protein M3R58_09020 [Pseudomonadota bacterium]|nr:hypothetical protein [Pseudomonadota bacterium]